MDAPHIFGNARHTVPNIIVRSTRSLREIAMYMGSTLYGERGLLMANVT